MVLYQLHRTYVRFFLPQSRMVAGFIGDHAPSTSIENCVEIGCGARLFETRIKSTWKPSHYIATDFDSNSRAGVVADATMLPFHSASVDLVIALQVLQHVPDSKLVLAEVARVLLPGSQLIASYPFMYSECDVMDFRRWTQQGMEQDLHAAGLQVIAHEKLGGPLFMIVMLMTALIAAFVPGGRSRWRGGTTRLGMLRIATVTALSFPFHLIGWIALTIDRLLPGAPTYVGGIVLAQKINP